jgi:hypothetical protein
VTVVARSFLSATIPRRWIKGLQKRKQSGWKRSLPKSTNEIRNIQTESNCLNKAMEVEHLTLANIVEAVVILAVVVVAIRFFVKRG